MARHPSNRILKNVVDIYFAVSIVDPDGGAQYSYPTLNYLQMSCSVQFRSAREVIDLQDRITVVNDYDIMFARQLGVTPRDKLIWTDAVGGQRTLFVEAPTDEAGRGIAFVIKASERQ